MSRCELTRVPFEYALLRYQHSVAAGELINVGIVAFSPTEARLAFKFVTRVGRVSKVFPGLSPGVFKRNLSTIRQAAGRLARTLVSERGALFDTGDPRVLQDLLCKIVPFDNNCFRWSDVRPGLCQNVERRVEQLACELLGTRTTAPLKKVRPKRRSRNDFQAQVQNWLVKAGLEEVVKPEEVDGETDHYTFPFCWINGKKSVLDVLSLEVDSADDMTQRAFAWRGRMDDLRRKGTDIAIHSLVTKPGSTAEHDTTVGYQQAMKVLQKSPLVQTVRSEDHFDDLIEMIKRDISHAGD